jgi:hypothetical protein
MNKYIKNFYLKIHLYLLSVLQGDMNVMLFCVFPTDITGSFTYSYVQLRVICLLTPTSADRLFGIH